jgi:hypothetical protein
MLRREKIDDDGCSSSIHIFIFVEFEGVRMLALCRDGSTQGIKNGKNFPRPSGALAFQVAHPIINVPVVSLHLRQRVIEDAELAIDVAQPRVDFPAQ